MSPACLPHGHALVWLEIWGAGQASSTVEETADQPIARPCGTRSPDAHLYLVGAVCLEKQYIASSIRQPLRGSGFQTAFMPCWLSPAVRTAQCRAELGRALRCGSHHRRRGECGVERADTPWRKFEGLVCVTKATGKPAMCADEPGQTIGFNETGGGRAPVLSLVPFVILYVKTGV